MKIELLMQLLIGGPDRRCFTPEFKVTGISVSVHFVIDIDLLTASVTARRSRSHCNNVAPLLLHENIRPAKASTSLQSLRTSLPNPQYQLPTLRGIFSERGLVQEELEHAMVVPLKLHYEYVMSFAVW